MTSAQIQAVAAIATLLAACAAVWATFRAPRLAAEFAENLRASATKVEEARRIKLAIFSNLLQYRAQIASEPCVATLNLIDFAYSDSVEVRNAWKDFLADTTADPFISMSVIERYLSIIHSMARHLGLSEQITIADIRAQYYPKGIGERAELEQLEFEQKLNSLRGQRIDQTS